MIRLRWSPNSYQSCPTSMCPCHSEVFTGAMVNMPGKKISEVGQWQLIPSLSKGQRCVDGWVANVCLDTHQMWSVQPHHRYQPVPQLTFNLMKQLLRETVAPFECTTDDGQLVRADTQHGNRLKPLPSFNVARLGYQISIGWDALVQFGTGGRVKLAWDSKKCFVLPCHDMVERLGNKSWHCSCTPIPSVSPNASRAPRARDCRSTICKARRLLLQLCKRRRFVWSSVLQLVVSCYVRAGHRRSIRSIQNATTSLLNCKSFTAYHSSKSWGLRATPETETELTGIDLHMRVIAPASSALRNRDFVASPHLHNLGQTQHGKSLDL